MTNKARKVLKFIIIGLAFLIVPLLVLLIAIELAKHSQSILSFADSYRMKRDHVVIARILFTAFVLLKWDAIVSFYASIRNITLSKVQLFQLKQYRIVFGASAIAIETFSIFLRLY